MASDNESCVLPCPALDGHVCSTHGIGSCDKLCHAIEVEPNDLCAAELLKNGSKVNYNSDKPHRTPLHCALLRHWSKLANDLLDRGAKVHIKDLCGKTPLHYAVEHSKDPQVVWKLILLGADINAVDNKGMTPLYYAVQNNLKEAVNVFTKYKIDLNNDGNKLAFRASLGLYRGNTIDKLPLTVFEILHNYGFRLSKLHILDSELVEQVVAHNYDMALAEFLRFGLDPNYYVTYESAWSKPYQKTLLQYAITCKNTKIIETLLKNGADINSIDEYGRTALFDTLLQNYESSATILLENGIDVNAALKNGTTALHYLAQFGYVSFIQLLIKYDANIEKKCNVGKTPLHYAAQWGWCNVICELVCHGADINTRMKGNLTPLHLAILNDHSDTVYTLLSYGADPDIQDCFGRTPMHIAATFKMTEMIKHLVSFSAKIYIKDNYGKTSYVQCTTKRDNENYALVYMQYWKIDREYKIYTNAPATINPIDVFDEPDFALNEQFNLDDREMYGDKLLSYLDNDFDDDDDDVDTNENIDDIITLNSNIEKYIKFCKNRLYVLKLPIDSLGSFISAMHTNKDQKILAKELLRMHTDEIYNGITMYDIMMMSCATVSRYLSHEQIINALIFSEYHIKYTYYSVSIKRKVEAAKKYIVRTRGEVSLKRILNNKLPDVVIREIMSCLSIPDIEPFCT